VSPAGKNDDEEAERPQTSESVPDGDDSRKPTGLGKPFQHHGVTSDYPLPRWAAEGVNQQQQEDLYRRAIKWFQDASPEQADEHTQDPPSTADSALWERWVRNNLPGSESAIEAATVAALNALFRGWNSYTAAEAARSAACVARESSTVATGSDTVQEPDVRGTIKDGPAEADSVPPRPIAASDTAGIAMHPVPELGGSDSMHHISSDGSHYWDGTAWRSTLSPDGNYRWDGSRWLRMTAHQQPLVESPHAVQGTIDRVKIRTSDFLATTLASHYSSARTVNDLGKECHSDAEVAAIAERNYFDKAFGRQVLLNLLVVGLAQVVLWQRLAWWTIFAAPVTYLLASLATNGSVWFFLARRYVRRAVQHHHAHPIVVAPSE
jgi:hypothetical protein